MRRECAHAAAALSLIVGVVSPVAAQLSSTSAWPKLQRDAANSGFAPVFGFVADVHVRWATRLRAPVSGEHHSTPVFSPDNSRLYVGGPASTLTAVNAADGSLAWTVQLGDGTGRILCTAVIGHDGSIYAGTWDTQSPYDGFAKLRDDGDSASVVWTFPMRRMLASPTIAPDGLIVIGGQHSDGTWAYFGLRDRGDTFEHVWTAGRLANPANPASTGAVGATAGLSLDGRMIFGGSDESRTFWQIGADGAELARVGLTQYVWAGAPLITEDSYALVGEGASFTPNDATEGKLYVIDFSGAAASVVESLPLAAGHLNGGAAALHPGWTGRRRLYVPANGNGKPTAQLIALDFDPAGPLALPPQSLLSRRWSLPLGPSAFAYPLAVVTADSLIYVLGPANHVLYAVRDRDSSGNTAWSLPLATISRATAWMPSARGPAGVTVGPDGSVYWHAVDGYLYCLVGWPAGDLDGDADVDAEDESWLAAIVENPERYDLLFPEIDRTAIGDLTGDGRLDAADAERLSAALALR